MHKHTHNKHARNGLPFSIDSYALIKPDENI